MRTIEYSNEKIYISDQERTILDVVNRPEYAGGWGEVINCLKNLENIKWNTLLRYIKRFGYMMDNLENISIPTEIKKVIKKYSGKNIYYFDPSKKGVFKREWNMVIPKKIEEVLHA